MEDIKTNVSIFQSKGDNSHNSMKPYTIRYDIDLWIAQTLAKIAQTQLTFIALLKE